MRAARLMPLLLLAIACNETKAAPPVQPEVAAAATPAATRPAKVVFIDQETACDCTRKRIDGTWTALQAALGQPAALSVERIHLDTQVAKAEAYTLLKPLMVVPGVYFVDEREGVLELLQGEVTQAQVAAVLKAK